MMTTKTEDVRGKVDDIEEKEENIRVQEEMKLKFDLLVLLYFQKVILFSLICNSKVL